MQPKTQEKTPQEDMFRNRLDVMLDHGHPLYVLACQIDWAVFEREFGSLYSEHGRPGVATRLMVGLHYLKHTFNESDESVVARFVENPYWQFFCGLEYFTHRLPIDPTTMTRWRKRVGADGMKKLLSETIATAMRRQELSPHECTKVNVDTTVQEKAIAHPTDARLYQKARVTLVRLAQARGLRLRQSYARLGKEALRKQGGYAHAKQFKRARRETRRLRTFLGCVLRDIERQCQTPDEKLASALAVARRIHAQKRDDKGKVYSVHAAEVECIAKGKAHKRYEFGCKASVVSTSRGNWVLAADALHGNPYDGHTLAAALASAATASGVSATQAFVDKGYRGAAKDVPEVEMYVSGTRRLPKALKRRLKRRQAIEPIIGHMKSDHRMDRNFLRGKVGDAINAILAACGFNMAKLFRAAALLARLSFLGYLFEVDPRGEQSLDQALAAA